MNSQELFWERRWQEHLAARRSLGLPTDIPRPPEYLPSITPAQLDHLRTERSSQDFVDRHFAL